MSKLSMTITSICLWMIASMHLSGCAGPWESAPRRLSTLQWSLTPPEGWMHLCMQNADMLSRDGPYLEYILVQSRPLEQGFRFTKQKISPQMLPHEVAGLIVDSLRADPLIRGFRMQSSEPAMVGGHGGFRLTFSYQDQNGVDLKTIYYGVVLPNLFFNLQYTATQRYYFDSQLPAFERVVHSLRFGPDSASPS